MRITLIRLAIALTLAGIAIPAVADGLVCEGHVSGPHTDLQLTIPQCASLFGGRAAIVLTPEQRRIMEKSTGVSTVSRLEVLPSNTETCTCEIANVGVQTWPGKLEVPNDLFGRDVMQEMRDQAEWDQRNSEKTAAESAEDKLKNPPPEVKLRQLAHKLGGERSIPLLQQAIQINPKYKLARMTLVDLYYAAADIDTMPPAKAVMSLRQALNAVDPTDAVMARTLKAKLDRASRRLNCH